MLGRRGFVGCALCAAAGLAATAVSAQADSSTPGITRVILQTTDGPMDGYVTILARGEIPPGAVVPRHTHPGIESGYVLDGSGLFAMAGQPDRVVKPGDLFHVPVGTPHGVKNGDTAMRIVSTYVVQKGKPLATLAPE